MSLRECEDWCHKWPSTLGTIQQHLRSRFRNTVTPFVSDVDGLCDVMRENDAVLSGSLALQFLDPSFVKSWIVRPGDMDLYTPLGSHQEMVNYLVFKEGYNVETQHLADDPPLGASSPNNKRFGTTRGRACVRRIHGELGEHRNNNDIAEGQHVC